MRVAASVFIGITTALTLSMDVLAIERNYVAVIYKNAFLPVPPSREFNTMARLTVSTLKPFDTAEECVEFGREQIFKYESVPDEYRDMMIDGDRPFSNPNANFSWVADCFKDEGGEFRSFWRETGPVY